MARETLPVSARTPLDVGQTVDVLWREAWYQALILLLEPGGGDVHVHFVGWDREWDAVVPRERVRVLVDWRPLDSPLEQGARVQARWQGSWYDAQVLVAEEGGARVRYTGWDQEHDATVRWDSLRRPVRLEAEPPHPRGKPLGRPAASPPPPGTLLEADWEGGWYAAVVLRSLPGAARVRYVGFGPDWDEDVPLERLRIGADLEVLETRTPAKPLEP